MTTTITTLPPAPNRQDPTTFEDKADTFLGALPLFGDELNALASELSSYQGAAISSATRSATAAIASETSANKAYASEVNSLINAQNSAASTNSSKWLSGTNYTAGTLVWSPINARNYRRLVNGAGTIDPSLDTANWIILSAVVEESDVGTEANQIPLNQNLGKLAFQNPESLVLKPSSSVTPLLIGDVVFELTSNSVLKIKAKGTDGVVRSATLTMS